jgi:uncharacterized protein (TIGR02284 family)
MSDNHSLAALHTALVDACNGYDEAILDAQKPDLKAIFETMKSLHEKAHAELHGALRSRGLAPDDSGSFMSAVHKTVISVRSAVAGLDDGSLSSFASGEERIVQDYDKAIEDNRDDGSLVSVLERQKAGLQSAIGDMKATADKAA